MIDIPVRNRSGTSAQTFLYNTYKRAYEPVSGFGFNRIKFEIVYDNDSEPEKYIRYFCRRNYKT